MSNKKVKQDRGPTSTGDGEAFLMDTADSWASKRPQPSRAEPRTVAFPTTGSAGPSSNKSSFFMTPTRGSPALANAES